MSTPTSVDMKAATFTDMKGALDAIRRRLIAALKRYGTRLHPTRLEYDITISNQIFELTKVVECLTENVEALKEKRQ